MIKALLIIDVSSLIQKEVGQQTIIRVAQGAVEDRQTGILTGAGREGVIYVRAIVQQDLGDFDRLLLQRLRALVPF